MDDPCGWCYGSLTWFTEHEPSFTNCGRIHMVAQGRLPDMDNPCGWFTYGLRINNLLSRSVKASTWVEQGRLLDMDNLDVSVQIFDFKRDFGHK